MGDIQGDSKDVLSKRRREALGTASVPVPFHGGGGVVGVQPLGTRSPSEVSAFASSFTASHMLATSLAML